MNWVNPHERALFLTSVAVSALVWVVLFALTLGTIAIFLLLLLPIYLFTKSAFLSHVKGTGVHITADQYPDLYHALHAACVAVNAQCVPDAYLLRTNARYAFMGRLSNSRTLVMDSDIVDALSNKPDALQFYIGHEIGRLERNHLAWRWFLFPASILPLLGSALTRAEIYICDRYGIACCSDITDVQAALGVIAAGHTRGQTLNGDAYLAQLQNTGDFWMSVHELTNDSPWLIKRFAQCSHAMQGSLNIVPRHHPLSWFIAACIPRVGLQTGAIVVVASLVFGLLGVYGYSEFKNYQMAHDVGYSMVYNATFPYTSEVSSYVEEKGSWPASMLDLGYDDIWVDSEVPRYLVYLHPSADAVEIAVQIGTDAEGLPMYLIYLPKNINSQIEWECQYLNVGLMSLLPAECQIEYGE